MNLNQSLARLSGLEQLQTIMASGQRPPIGETLDFDLAEIGEGRAVFTGRPSARLFNPLGIVHGGYAATLLDSACGCAVHSRLSAEQSFTTLELKIAYHRALTPQSGLVRVEGQVISMGRRVAYSEARLLDGEGRLCASASSTLLVFERNPAKV